MIRLNFNLKSPKSDNSLVIARSLIGSSRLVVSTGIKIPTKYWNNQTRSIRDNAEFKNAKLYQLELDRFSVSFNKTKNHFVKTDKAPTIDSFKNILKQNLTGVRSPISSQEIPSFNEFMKIFIQRRIESPKYRPESIKVYKTLQVHFLRYVKNRTIEFTDLTIPFIEDFTNYLQDKDYSDNHVNKIFTTMKTMLNEASDLGLNHQFAYKSRRLCVAKREADSIYLTLPEINRLFELDIKGQSQITRDLFIIGCCTGLRYSDFSSLSKGNIFSLPNGSKALRIITKKTNDKIVIPLNTMVIKILEKYNYDLPNGICNQTMNKILKVISEEAKINESYQKRVFRSNKAVVTEYKKYELVCTHTARRTFATNAYKANVPVPSIMKITGHKKHETFMKYLCLSNDEHALLMSSNEFFK